MRAWTSDGHAARTGPGRFRTRPFPRHGRPRPAGPSDAALPGGADGVLADQGRCARRRTGPLLNDPHPTGELPELLAEQVRVLAPGGVLLVSFFGTDGPEPVKFDHKVAPAYSWRRTTSPNCWPMPDSFLSLGCSTTRPPNGAFSTPTCWPAAHRSIRPAGGLAPSARRARQVVLVGRLRTGLRRVVVSVRRSSSVRSSWMTWA